MARRTPALSIEDSWPPHPAAGNPPGRHPARGGRALHQEQANRASEPRSFRRQYGATAAGAGRSCEKGQQGPAEPRPAQRHILRLMVTMG
jgi:hypothetical protein